MTESEKILQTEFSEEFVTLMKAAMIHSFYKYGPLKDNFGGNLKNAEEDMRIRIQEYEKTGDMNLLVDVANYAMIEFMFPSNKKAHRKNDYESHVRNSGMGINEIKRLG